MNSACWRNLSVFRAQPFYRIKVHKMIMLNAYLFLFSLKIKKSNLPKSEKYQPRKFLAREL